MATKKPEHRVRATKRRRAQPPSPGSGHAGLAEEYLTSIDVRQWRASLSRSDVPACTRPATPNHQSVTTTLVIMTLPLDDPITNYLYGLAWEKAIERLPEPPQSTAGPVTKKEHLALLSTLSDFSAGIET